MATQRLTPLQGRKLGLLISCAPDRPNFARGLALAEAALEAGVRVYLYCIDDAVAGVGDSRLQALTNRGIHLFACAYAAQRRNRSREEHAAWGGLSSLTDILVGADRFVSFN